MVYKDYHTFMHIQSKKYYTDIAATGQLGKLSLLGHSEKLTDPF